jgi:BON domain
MSQREDTRDNEHVERGREPNGGRDFYPGGHGFDDTHDRAYSQGAAGRDTERWNEGSERSRHEQRGEGWGAGRGRGWDAGRDRGWDAGRERSWSAGREGGRDAERGRGWDAGREGGRDAGRGRGWDARRAGGWDPGRGSGGGGYYEPRGYWSDRPSWQDPYGFGQRSQWREPSLWDRRSFGPPEDTHYYGTGSAGWGGPGFTGGAYAYGNGPRERSLPLEDEYSDESSVSYEQGPRQQYDQQYGQRFGQQPRYGQPQYGQRPSYNPYGGYPETRARRFGGGPKGYQRSDERLREDISERLMESHYIDSSDVSVEVRGAKVVLEGTVPSRQMKHAIEDLVDVCPGVQDIDNRVRVGNPLARQSQSGQSLGGQSQGVTGAVTSSGVGSSAAGNGTPNGTKARQGKLSAWGIVRSARGATNASPAE